MGNKLTIGLRLKEERERLLLNQDAFAAVAGVTRKTLFGYESDARHPDAEALGAWEAIGLDVLYVVAGKRRQELPPVLASDEDVLLDAYRALEPSMRRRVLAFILGGEPAPAAPKKPKQTVKSGVGQQFNGPVGVVAEGEIHTKGKEKKS